MIVGWFGFDGSPFVSVRVTIPRLGAQREVDFLVDTGSDITCVNHRDAVNMGLFPEVLRADDMSSATGIGGSTMYFREDAHIAFLDTVGGQIHEHALSLRIADLSDAPMAIPSLLGRDILNRYNMVYAPAERGLTLDAPA